MDPWKTVFLYNPLVFRLHVNLPGCKTFVLRIHIAPHRPRQASLLQMDSASSWGPSPVPAFDVGGDADVPG